MSRLYSGLAVVVLTLPVAVLAGPHQELGKGEGRCRTNEVGPALLVSAIGLKDRAGDLKLEVYPANDKDFRARG